MSLRLDGLKEDIASLQLALGQISGQLTASANAAANEAARRAAAEEAAKKSADDEAAKQAEIDQLASTVKALRDQLAAMIAPQAQAAPVQA